MLCVVTLSMLCVDAGSSREQINSHQIQTSELLYLPKLICGLYSDEVQMLCVDKQTFLVNKNRIILAFSVPLRSQSVLAQKFEMREFFKFKNLHQQSHLKFSLEICVMRLFFWYSFKVVFISPHQSGRGGGSGREPLSVPRPQHHWTLNSRLFYSRACWNKPYGNIAGREHRMFFSYISQEGGNDWTPSRDINTWQHVEMLCRYSGIWQIRWWDILFTVILATRASSVPLQDMH